MTELEFKLIDIIRRCPDPEQAASVAIKVVTDFLELPSPSQEPKPFYPRQFA